MCMTTLWKGSLQRNRTSPWLDEVGFILSLTLRGLLPSMSSDTFNKHPSFSGFNHCFKKKYVTTLYVFQKDPSTQNKGKIELGLNNTK